jgi:hypothetical protein
MTTLANLVRLVMIGACAVAFATPEPVAAQRQTQPGEGVMCLLALTAAASHVADVCHPGEAPELATELHAGADRLGRYVVENGWTVVELERFLREQAHVDAASDLICQTAAESFYQSFRAQPEALAESVAAVTARAGRPTWGDCV